MINYRLMAAIILSLVFHGILAGALSESASQFSNVDLPREHNSIEIELVKAPQESPNLSHPKIDPPSQGEESEIAPKSIVQESDPQPDFQEQTEGEVPLNSQVSQVVSDRESEESFRFEPHNGVLVQTRPMAIKNEAPVYPKRALMSGYEGTVVLRVEVRADGSCGLVEVYESSGYRILDQAAVHAVKNWKFVPALQGSTKVRSWMGIPIEFKINKSSV